MSNTCYDIVSLRESVRSRMDARRYAHTLGVERAAVMLGELYMPKRIPELQCAALLHDITKNETTEKQLQYLSEFDIILCGSDKVSPKLFHAATAAAVIGRDFAKYADEDIVSAVRWHTTGRDGMSLFDIIIYLADYIEDTRTFEDCVRLREYFFGKHPEDMTAQERLLHLYKTAVMSVDMTVTGLIAENAYIATDTVDFRNYCLRLINDMQTVPAKQKGVDHNE